MEIRGITIAVGDWYAATLAICLPRNMRHLSECLVVTSPEDHAVRQVVEAVPGARLFVTDAMRRHGAAFNKGLCMEEGLSALGRSGWLLIHDADILLPSRLPLDHVRLGRIHGCLRRTLADPSQWREDLDWSTCPRERDGGAVGFFQLVHADDPAIASRRPWYDVSFSHAGGGDAYFMMLWPPSSRRVLPFDCLHLGPRDAHWFGTDPEAQDIMQAFVIRNGWTRRRPLADPAAVERVGEIVERVEVPGYAPSGFELPFVRRHRQG